jgi:hypothetical protein
MIYDYIVIFAFKDGFFKYRKQMKSENQAIQVILLAWQDHEKVIGELNEAHPETSDTFLDFALVEGIEVIALHTIAWEGRPV